MTSKPWSFALSPYLWLTNIAIDTDERSLNADIEDLARKMEAALMLNASVQYRDFGLVADYLFVKLGADRAIGPATADLTMTQHVLDMRATYRVLDTRHASNPTQVGHQLFVDSGARYWNVGGDIRLRVPPALPNGDGIEASRSLKSTWADWIVGLHLVSTVTDRVTFAVNANVGGFNIADSSRYTLSGTGGVFFRVWKSLYLDVGYRAIHFSRPATSSFPVTKVTMNGLMTGLTVWM